MRLILLLICLLFLSCNTAPTVDIKRGLIAENAMVVTARIEASEIGLQVLKQGGNVFDAMIATELALAVAFPYAGNIGGGGFMVYRTTEGETGALDYREKAPLAAQKDMFLDENGEIIPGKSTLGGSAVGVPGTIAGIFAVHEKFGSVPIEDLFKPVIELALKGVVVTENQELNLKKSRDLITKVSGENTLFSKIYTAKDTIKHKTLAQTLKRIKTNGKDEFYRGETALKIVELLQKNGSIITLKDLEKYEAQWREPIHFNYKDLNIISMSPPSSGGICLAQILKMIEPYDLKSFGHNSADYIQVLTEAMRRAYADRSQYLGDPDFVDVPVEQLLSESYLKQRMSNFSFDFASPSTEITYGNIEMVGENDETTHYSIVDQFGNALAATTTLNGAYGSKLYSEELGFFFNNEMDDFSAKTGEPNMFGLTGTKANSIAPEKRMLSSMTPTIVEKNGILWMVIGTPGGSRIITSVLQSILNVYEFELSMQQAADAPRFHHQWLPDEIYFESETTTTKTIEILKNKGYNISSQEARIIGSITAILLLENGKMEAGADYRRDNAAAGF